MVNSRVRRKVKAAVKFLTSPPTPLDPEKRYPVRVRYALLWVVCGLFVEWYYFFVQVSYDSIPGKPLFWVAFVGWAMPGVIIEWVYRNLPTKQLINKYANFMIGFGLVAITIGVIVRRGDQQILPIAYALIPGFIAGAGIGSESLLVWNLIKNRYAHSETANPHLLPEKPGPQSRRSSQNDISGD